MFVAALIGALVAAWRWFIAHRAAIVEWIVAWWHRQLRRPRLHRFRARYPRAWRFLAARFARGEYLGLHLTLGLLVSVAGLWVFAGVTEDVIHHDPLTHFDVSLFDWLQAHSTHGGLAIARAISLLGSVLAMSLLAIGVAGVLALRRQGLLLQGWIAAFLGGGLLNEVLKRVIHRPRPTHAAMSALRSWSFPSGHAMGSLIGYGMLVYMLFALVPSLRTRRMTILVCAALLVLGIGLSRLYLGVHYFSDVVGGFAAGALWLSTSISGLEVARRWRAEQ